MIIYKITNIIGVNVVIEDIGVVVSPKSSIIITEHQYSNSRDLRWVLKFIKIEKIERLDVKNNVKIFPFSDKVEPKKPDVDDKRQIVDMLKQAIAEASVDIIESMKKLGVLSQMPGNPDSGYRTTPNIPNNNHHKGHGRTSYDSSPDIYQDPVFLPSQIVPDSSSVSDKNVVVSEQKSNINMDNAIEELRRMQAKK